MVRLRAELEAYITNLAGLYSPTEREEVRVELFDLMKALLPLPTSGQRSDLAKIGQQPVSIAALIGASVRRQNDYVAQSPGGYAPGRAGSRGLQAGS